MVEIIRPRVSDMRSTRDRGSRRRQAPLLMLAIVVAACATGASGDLEAEDILVEVDDPTPTLTSASPEVLSAEGIVAWLRKPVTGSVTDASVLSPELADRLPGFVASAPPDRFILGTLESFEWTARCGAENGEFLEVRPGDPPSLGWETNPRTQRVVDACWEASVVMTWGLMLPVDNSPEVNRLTYPLWLEVHQCLLENGYPTVEPPSEDAFAEGGSRLWNPYAGMTGLPFAGSAVTQLQREQLAAQELCGVTAVAKLQQRASETP